VTHRNGERCSAAKAYLTPARARSNLSVITNVRVTRIVTEGRRATGVEFLRAGERHRVAASREVLLCAGALQSPQLLLLSGIGAGDELQRHGIAPVHELAGVGRHLHDHPDVVQVIDAPQLKDLFGLSFTGAVRVLQGVLEWRRQRSGMLTTNFAEAGGFIKSNPQEPIPDLQLHFVIGKLIDHGRKTVFGHGYSCHVCLLRPKSRGRVSLFSADPTAAPRIDPNFLAERDDVDRLVRGFKLMRTILSQRALAGYAGRELDASAQARTDVEIEAFVRAYGDTIYHPVGSCRMGNGPLDVVDAQLRVHGMQGLRVIDASIMPRIIGGNTNAATIMIAEKASDLIRAAQPANAVLTTATPAALAA
jgi:choline dehydrogenase-like flavoprotein